MRDAGLQVPLCRKLDQRFHVGDGECRVRFVQAADEHAHRIDAFDEQIVAAYVRRPATQKAEYEKPPAPRERAQRFLRHLVADRIVDDVDAPPRR
jgi:hypothetical protein